MICCPPIGNRLSLASHNSLAPRPNPLEVPARVLDHHPVNDLLRDAQLHQLGDEVAAQPEVGVGVLVAGGEAGGAYAG